jgi:hypothetical protein
MSNRDLQVDAIPQCLRDLPQWCCWKYVPNESGEPGKLPVQAASGKEAKTNDSRTWTTFDAALEAYRRSPGFAGIAFIFTESDPFVGVDLDDCLDKQGNFLWGQDIVQALKSYCEVSPSGEGVKLFLRGKKPEWAGCIVKGFGPKAIGKVEVYERGRCFAVTGRKLGFLPADVMERQTELEALCKYLWPQECSEKKVSPSINIDPPAESKAEAILPQRSASSEILDRMRSCYKAILAMKLTDSGDGSHRLFSACCRCVEFDLPDEGAIRVIRKYARSQPFPKSWSNVEIAKRLRSAEKKAKRGHALLGQRKVIPSLRSVGQLLLDNPELRPPVIQGLLRTGETMNVIAPPKYGKSWLVTDLALSVATGRRWLDAFETVPGNVLILDNELHSETSANRIPKVADARGISLEEITDRLFVDNLRGRLLDVNTLQPYFESLQKGFFKIIVLDAFYRFLPKDSDENSNANMTDVYNRLDWYAAMLGCSFVLVHHASKGNQSGKSVTDVGAGAGSQARASDTHLILRQHEEDGCVVADAAVRSWHPLDPLCLRWSFPVWSIDDSLDPACLRPERPRKRPKPKDEETPKEPEWTPQRFADAFVTPEPTTIKSILQLAKEAGVSQKLAKLQLQLAEDAGLVYRWSFGANRPVKFATVLQPESNLQLA